MKNIHDKFVKATFSDTGRAIAFFEKFLPATITNSLDLKTLQCLDESYMDEDLKEYFSDLVFEVKGKESSDQVTDIVLLFEHKSSPDRYVLIQVGVYMFSHWWKCVRENKPLKPIIPIIYYQGKRKWKLKALWELFGNSSGDVPLFIPEIRHIFIALQSLTDEEIVSLRNKLMATALMAQKSAFNEIKMAEDLEKILRLFPIKPVKGNFLKSIFVYLYSVAEIPKQEWVKVLESIPTDIKKDIMTTYEWMIKEGEEIGIQKGRLEGRLEGEQLGILKEKTEVILALYADKIPVHSISKYTKLSEEEVMRIVKDHEESKE